MSPVGGTARPSRRLWASLAQLADRPIELLEGLQGDGMLVGSVGRDTAPMVGILTGSGRGGLLDLAAKSVGLLMQAAEPSGRLAGGFLSLFGLPLEALQVAGEAGAIGHARTSGMAR